MRRESVCCRGLGPAVLPLVLFLAAGCEKPRISGEVIDAVSGQPLGGAVVRVPGTEFQATSRNDGRYAVGYAPGEVAIEFEKTGFVPTRYLAEAVGRAGHAAGAVRMYRLPPQPGLFGIDTAAGDYRPLAAVRTCGATESAWRGGGQYERLTTYGIPAVTDAAPQFAPGRVTFVAFRTGELSPREDVPFLRADTEDFELMAVAEDGTVLQRGSSRDLTRKIRPVERTDAGNGVWVLSYELPAGVYAFVNTNRLEPDQGLPFRVGSPRRLPASTCGG